MIMALGWCVLALIFLALGGDSVLKGASGLSRRFHWSPFVTGLLLVAFGLHLPIWSGQHARIRYRQPKPGAGQRHRQQYRQFRPDTWPGCDGRTAAGALACAGASADLSDCRHHRTDRAGLRRRVDPHRRRVLRACVRGGSGGCDRAQPARDAGGAGSDRRLSHDRRRSGAECPQRIREKRGKS